MLPAYKTRGRNMRFMRYSSVTETSEGSNISETLRCVQTSKVEQVERRTASCSHATLSSVVLCILYIYRQNIYIQKTHGTNFNSRYEYPKQRLFQE